jgi:hypothetical protein
VTFERRMKRAETLLKIFLRRGRKYRNEFRENFEMLVNAQIATEDQIKRTDEQIAAFAVETKQALDRLAAGQAKTDEALRRFINSLNTGRNGNSEN